MASSAQQVDDPDGLLELVRTGGGSVSELRQLTLTDKAAFTERAKELGFSKLGMRTKLQLLLRSLASEDEPGKEPARLPITRTPSKSSSAGPQVKASEVR